MRYGTVYGQFMEFLQQIQTLIGNRILLICWNYSNCLDNAFTLGSTGVVEQSCKTSRPSSCSVPALVLHMKVQV